MNTDLRLSSAYTLMNTGDIKTLSLDIFDTLLWRKAPLPIDLFLILGRQLKNEGWLIEAVTAECFAELRILAQQLTRQKKIKSGALPEITLHDIYWNFSGIFTKISVEEMIEGKKGIINESDVNDLVAMEVALEKQFTQFDLNILRLIHHAREKNIPVILMSDTYLSQEHIESILDRSDPISSTPFLQLIEKLYISSEHGCGKQLGLFHVMLKDLNINHESILHIGDNYKSDCISAEAAGIRTLYYEKGNKELADIIEEEWPKESSIARAQQLDPQQGDFGLAALRSKLIHDSAQSELNVDDAFYWKYGATVLGPVLTGFVQWVYKRCQELGQSQVFCLLREGRLYANLIKQCAPFHPNIPLDAKELWVSRQYMMRTCIFQGSSEELLAVFQTHLSAPYTVGTYCASLGLDIGKIGKFTKYKNVILDNETLILDLINHLSNNAALREKIIQCSYEKRKRFLKYLSSIVDLSSISQMTLVDVGWKGTAQGALQMLLYMEGYKIVVHGLYLASTEGTLSALMQGFIREGYLLQGGHPKNAVKAIRICPHILERSAQLDLHPLIDYDTDGRVINGKLFTPKTQLKQVQLVQDGIFAFCRQLHQYIQSGAITWNSASESLAEQLRQVLMRSTSLPTFKEASKFGTWRHDIRSGVNISPLLAKNTYYERFIGDMFPQAIFKDPFLVWPSAYLAKYDRSLTKALQAIIQEKLPVESFLSHEKFPLKIFLDTGKGFPKRATQTILLQSNANRSFFILEKLHSFKKPIQKLRLEFICSSTRLRIKSLRLTVNYLKKSEPEMLTFFESSSIENATNLEFHNSEQVEPGTFFLKNSSFMLTYSFESDDIYAVQVSMCCEKF